ncbi:MAG: hypothetical protein ACRD3Y_03100 [Bryobacteraceae bacterium]
MAVTISAITNVDATQNQFVVDGSLTLSGDYGAANTHGDTLSFAGFDQIKSSVAPTRVEIFEAPAAGTSATGFVYSFSPGSTQANGVLQVFGTPATGAATTPLTEYTEAAAYSAGLKAAALKFRAWFPSFA